MSLNPSLTILLLFISIPLITSQNPSPNFNSKKTLVLLEDWQTVDTHSLFFSQIKSMGFDLDFRMINDEDITLTYFGEYIYSSIIFMAPSLNDEDKRLNEIKIAPLLKFLDDGHDIFFFANKNVGSFLRKMANEFGIDFDDYDSQIKDSLYLKMFRNEISAPLYSLNSDDITATKNVINIPALTKKPKNFILYEGIGMDVDPQNKYVFTILKGESNAYSINKKTSEVYANGDKVKLVTGYQARNNRRVIISGSMDMCSDKFYYLSNVEGVDISESQNAKFCRDLINWNFQRSCVLKYDNIKHKRTTDGVTLQTYRIKDYLEYYVDIFEYDYMKDSWKPYVADDIQVEYDMMNPYYINQLQILEKNKPTYFVKFRAPEKHGVYKFIIDYKRPGYSYILSSTKVPLRPFNHNEFDRFLACAYPYYLTNFVVLVSFVIFCVLFIYGKKEKENNEN